MHNAKAKQTAEFFRTATANDICEFVNNLTGECWHTGSDLFLSPYTKIRVFPGDEGGVVTIQVDYSDSINGKITDIHIESAGFAMDFDLENNYLES